ncbi:hypothetical protein LFDSGCCC_CDS0048 [Phage C75C1]|nr:hypothetical protein LFDSGCCC_CDS0048 [Phage C75C1]
MPPRKTPKKKTAKKAPKATGSSSKIAKLEQRIAALEAKMGGNRPQAPRPQAPRPQPQMAQRPQAPARPQMPRPQIAQGGMPRPPMPGMRG